MKQSTKVNILEILEKKAFLKIVKLDLNTHTDGIQSYRGNPYLNMVISPKPTHADILGYPADSIGRDAESHVTLLSNN